MVPTKAQIPAGSRINIHLELSYLFQWKSNQVIISGTTVRTHEQYIFQVIIVL